MDREAWGLERYLNGTPSDMYYIEWKYFRFQTEDALGIVSYSVGDPRNILGQAKGLIYVSVWHDGRNQSETIEVPFGDCSFSGKSSSAILGKNRITQVRDGLRLTGSGESIVWDLTFRGQSRVAYNHNLLRSFIYPNSWLDWIIFRPFSEVTGTISLGDLRIPVEGTGYHDGNRGKWVPFMPMWNFLLYQGSMEGRNVTLAMARCCNNRRGGDAHLFLDGCHVHFRKHQFRVRNLEWGKDPATGAKMPLKTEFRAGKGRARVRALFKAKGMDSLTIWLPSALPNLVITEQVADAAILVESAGKVMFSDMHGIGHNEHTARKFL